MEMQAALDVLQHFLRRKYQTTNHGGEHQVASYLKQTAASKHQSRLSSQKKIKSTKAACVADTCA
eukprot:875991-Pelagomonas_calceolata.AAC.5